ncbi:MAG: hypothetical protein ACXWWD_08055 [Chitinophagaceae bacterium]
MKYIKILFLLCSVLISNGLWAQAETTETLSPKLFLEFSLVDFPFQQHAAQTYANHRTGLGMGCQCKTQVGDYIKSFGGPSMEQALQLSKNLYGAVGYFTEIGSQKLFKPGFSKGKKVLARIAGEGFSLITSGFLMTAPFGQAWLHEEYHRNPLIRRQIYSYNEVWKFKGGDFIKVSNVLDQDLIEYKKKYPQEHIRMSAAGIEGEVQLAREYQKDQFFREFNTPIMGPYLFSVLGVFGYVTSTKDYEDIKQSLAEANAEEWDMRDRDFTGHDIASWTYDLFRPFEPFENRGPHPSGTGVDRYINPEFDFTPEMTTYIDKMARRSALNFLSPSLIGIRKIKLKEGHYFNFALRHTLTCFGDDRQGDILLKNRWGNFMVSYHNYSNQTKNFKGIEFQMVDKKVQFLKRGVAIDARVMYWSQPAELLFNDVKGQPGGAMEVRIAPQINKWYSPYFEFEGKTKGWLTGNPYQNSNISFKMGLRAEFVYKKK